MQRCRCRHVGQVLFRATDRADTPFGTDFSRCPVKGKRRERCCPDAFLDPTPLFGVTDEQLTAELKKCSGKLSEQHPVGELLGRHWEAAFSYASLCTTGAHPAGILTSTAFTRLFGEALRRNRTWATAWRPRVLATVRGIAEEWNTGPRGALLHPGLRAVRRERGHMDGRLRPPENRRLVFRAFQRLPDSARCLLWHTEVEAEQPAVPAGLLGVSDGAHAELERARERWRQACLEAHCEHGPRGGVPTVQPSAGRLAPPRRHPGRPRSAAASGPVRALPSGRRPAGPLLRPVGRPARRSGPGVGCAGLSRLPSRPPRRRTGPGRASLSRTTHADHSATGRRATGRRPSPLGAERPLVEGAPGGGPGVARGSALGGEPARAPKAATRHPGTAPRRGGGHGERLRPGVGGGGVRPPVRRWRRRGVRP